MNDILKLKLFIDEFVECRLNQIRRLVSICKLAKPLYRVCNGVYGRINSGKFKGTLDRRVASH